MKVIVCSPALSYQADAPYSTRARANAMAAQNLHVTVVGFQSVYPPNVGPCQFDYVSVFERQTAGTKIRWLAWKQKLGTLWSHAIEPYWTMRASFRYAREQGADILYVANIEPFIFSACAF